MATNNPPFRRCLTAKQEQAVCNGYKGGASSKQLAKQCGCSVPVILRCLRRHNVPVRDARWRLSICNVPPRRTYTINENGEQSIACLICNVVKPISEFYKRGRPVRRCGNPDHFPYCIPCHRKQEIERNRRIKAELIEAYGGQCVCCGETTLEFLTVDHIYNDGKSDRGTAFYRRLRRQGYPKGRYQLLCWNCNCAKGRYGICPHELARQQLPKPLEI